MLYAKPLVLPEKSALEYLIPSNMWKLLKMCILDEFGLPVWLLHLAQCYLNYAQCPIISKYKFKRCFRFNIQSINLMPFKMTVIHKIENTFSTFIGNLTGNIISMTVNNYIPKLHVLLPPIKWGFRSPFGPSFFIPRPFCYPACSYLWFMAFPTCLCLPLFSVATGGASSCIIEKACLCISVLNAYNVFPTSHM